MVTQFRLNGNDYRLSNAATWLREELAIDRKFPVFDEFEKYFNCKIYVDDRKDNWMEPNYVEFNTGQDYVMFLLRWA